MIDLHCHILPGIDDGPEELVESLEMARRHVAAGVDTVIATPHVSWDHRNTAEGIAEATARLQRALDVEQIPLRVLAGAEVALTRAVELPHEELQALTLGGGPWLLLEAPIALDAPGTDALVEVVRDHGVEVLLAHPERCASFHSDPELLARLVDAGCTAQVTAGALVGSFGRTVQALARRFVEQGHVHVVASDAHDPERRAPGLLEPLVAGGYGELAQWMTADVPRALLVGGEVPERPLPAGEPRGARRGLLRRRRG
ncbi:CpsB/CapC family capsule biosynthesis tyrosine phosphatase [Patulibacter brassicae]|uniref:protein-tyrosine-phosphatase n=1 Tax=Patulibacter brassicae TaxID=1705717 RepID=A0ABU4VJG6_9ACTN|nr:CpsB/CapC family capsule biosynthesis tyrosine phosphatase [Patulibacter brassicae]MDX8151053.1 CpsB/CapC family capsule biosynthesis tyrosine phosphatase [Patulibacter brassicae]